MTLEYEGVVDDSSIKLEIKCSLCDLGDFGGTFVGDKETLVDPLLNAFTHDRNHIRKGESAVVTVKGS